MGNQEAVIIHEDIPLYTCAMEAAIEALQGLQKRNSTKSAFGNRVVLGECTALLTCDRHMQELLPLVSKTILFWVRPSHVVCCELIFGVCLCRETTTNAIESIKCLSEPAGVGRAVGIAVGIPFTTGGLKPRSTGG